MLESSRSRVLAVVCCLVVLGGLFVVHGTIAPDPERNHYASNGELAADYDAHVGDRVVLGGTAAETDPVVLTIGDGSDGEERHLVLEGLEDVTAGEDLWLSGTVQPGETITVERAVVRESWERQYMYVVSFLGGVWVLGRFLREWRFEAREVAFVPREDTTEETTRTDGRFERGREDGDQAADRDGDGIEAETTTAAQTEAM